jgi:hypothetical protein
MTRHLLAVWNPSYEADALQLHLEVLLRTMREHRAGTREEEDVYVWWGKVASSNRLQPLPHLADVLAIDELANSDSSDAEINLYLTDYRSLYVAHLGEVTADDVREYPDESAHIPTYYNTDGLNCDFWFRLFDIRRLVLDDTPSVIRELKQLMNTRYYDKPVSLYGGMSELPLIVTRPDEATWFDRETRERLTGGRFWAEYDAERAGAGAMQRELRENRFGNAAWEQLDPAARGFVASAEEVFRRHRDDPAFDLHAVVIDLANAVEVQTNAILRRALAGAPTTVRMANVEGTSLDLARQGPLSLGQLAHAIGEDQERNAFLKKRLEGGEFFTASLPAILKELTDVRNPAAHGGAIAREDAIKLRNRMIGVGSIGQLLQLAQVKVR